MPSARSGSATPSGSVDSASQTPFRSTRVLAAPIAGVRGLDTPATASAASLYGVVTDRPRSGRPKRLEQAALDHFEPEVAEVLGVEGEVERRDAELPVRPVVQAGREGVVDRSADDAEKGLCRRQRRQPKVVDQPVDRRLARGAGRIAGEGAEDHRRPQPRRHQARPDPGRAGGEGDDVVSARSRCRSEELLEQDERRQLLPRRHRRGDQLVEPGRGRVHPVDAPLQGLGVGRGAVPGEDAALGRNRLEHRRHQVAVGLQVDQGPALGPARRRQQLGARGRVVRAVAPFGPAAEGIDQVAVEALVERPERSLRQGAVLARTGAIRPNFQRERPSGGRGGGLATPDQVAQARDQLRRLGQPAQGGDDACRSLQNRKPPSGSVEDPGRRLAGNGGLASRVGTGTGPGSVPVVMHPAVPPAGGGRVDAALDGRDDRGDDGGCGAYGHVRAPDRSRA